MDTQLCQLDPMISFMSQGETETQSEATRCMSHTTLGPSHPEFQILLLVWLGSSLPLSVLSAVPVSPLLSAFLLFSFPFSVSASRPASISTTLLLPLIPSRGLGHAQAGLRHSL